jgi:hypothetical protein
MTQDPDKTAGDGKPQEGSVQGEGDYVAARRFQDAERSFAENESLVQRKAREAAEALDGPEANDLEEARVATGEGKIHAHPPAHKAGDASDPHTEENLDKGLDETFPASDPVSISPGAD